MNTKQLEQPSKKFAVAHRRVMESVGVTATKWWNER
jgi:hypothetical protein